MPRAALLPSCLLVLLAACASRSSAPETPQPPAVVMYGARLRSFEGGTLSLSGEAERATYERTGELVATRALLRVPGQVPADVTTVRAREIAGNAGTRQLVASGDVEVRTAAGMVARTPRAFYDGAAQSARGAEGVQVQGPDYRLSADTFLLSLPEGQFTFEGSVRTVLEGAP